MVYKRILSTGTIIVVALLLEGRECGRHDDDTEYKFEPPYGGHASNETNNGDLGFDQSSLFNPGVTLGVFLGLFLVSSILMIVGVVCCTKNNKRPKMNPDSDMNRFVPSLIRPLANRDVFNKSPFDVVELGVYGSVYTTKTTGKEPKVTYMMPPSYEEVIKHKNNDECSNI